MLDKVGVRLQVGDAAPDFAFTSEAFGSVSAASLRGKRYVMYFYPKDDTPGCTREACAFRDNLPRFGGIGIKVFGVSADDEKSHLRFARKHSLPFKLIPDPDHVICEAFGTWVEKNMYGRSYMGVARSTFVIGPDGKIEKIWEKVAPDGHAEEVFAWLNGDPVPLPFKPAAAVKPVVAKPIAATPIKAMPTTAPKSSPVSAKTVAPTKPTAVTVKPAVTPIKPKAKAAPTQPAVKTRLAPAKSKPAAAKPAPKKVIPKKVSAAKPLAKKGSAKNVAVKKTPAKKAAIKKPVTKPALAKKAPPKKPTVKKTAMKKPVAKKAAVKKLPVKKARR